MEVWGFRGIRAEHAPAEADVVEARSRVGWHRVEIGRTDGDAWIDAGGTALDLSAIAKGHAVDRVSALLSRLGAAHHMVEIGGEVRAHGQGPAGPWRVGIDVPDASATPGRELAAVSHLVNTSMATSGNYRNAYDADGVHIVHTMDPRRGRPHLSEVASATVWAPDCRTADGWATALMVLSLQEGLAVVDARPNLDALWLVAGPDGLVERRSDGADGRLAP